VQHEVPIDPRPTRDTTTAPVTQSIAPAVQMPAAPSVIPQTAAAPAIIPPAVAPTVAPPAPVATAISWNFSWNWEPLLAPWTDWLTRSNVPLPEKIRLISDDEPTILSETTDPGDANR
jgi:hypothetical protein